MFLLFYKALEESTSTFVVAWFTLMKDTQFLTERNFVSSFSLCALLRFPDQLPSVLSPTTRILLVPINTQQHLHPLFPLLHYNTLESKSSFKRSGRPQFQASPPLHHPQILGLPADWARFQMVTFTSRIQLELRPSLSVSLRQHIILQPAFPVSVGA